MNELKTLADHRNHVQNILSDGPKRWTQLWIPNVSEKFMRLRIALGSAVDFLPVDCVAEEPLTECQKLVSQIEGILGDHEATTLGSLGMAENDLLKYADLMFSLVVDAQCKLAHAEGRIEGYAREIVELKRKLEVREERLREHDRSNPEVRAKVFALTGGKCAYCSVDISDDPSDEKLAFSVEHVVPKDHGGPDHLSNYVPACMPCNNKKRTAHVLEFIHYRLGVVQPTSNVDADRVVEMPVRVLDAAE